MLTQQILSVLLYLKPPKKVYRAKPVTEHTCEAWWIKSCQFLLNCIDGQTDEHTCRQDRQLNRHQSVSPLWGKRYN